MAYKPSKLRRLSLFSFAVNIVPARCYKSGLAFPGSVGTKTRGRLITQRAFRCNFEALLSLFTRSMVIRSFLCGSS
jgi:hypothetical protein